MSTGPRMIVSSRGDAAQISSTSMSPRAVSIWASMPMWWSGRPALASTWVSNRSRATISAAAWPLGSISSSRRSPALPTTSITSPYVHFVSHALTRTQRTLSPQSWFLTASTALARAASFSRGATESSRSMNTMSAGRAGALASIFSLDPGTDRQDRRGRVRVRSDMLEAYGTPPTCRQAITLLTELGPQELEGAHPRLAGRLLVVHLRAGVVEERVLGARVHEELALLAQALELVLERLHRGRAGKPSFSA